MQLTDREFWLLLLGIAYGVKFSEAFDRSGADQVIENVAHKVPDVADQARQFAELAMDLPNEMRPFMGDLLPGSNSEAAWYSRRSRWERSAKESAVWLYSWRRRVEHLRKA